MKMDAMSRWIEVKESIEELQKDIKADCPSSREAVLVLTKLDEARMWAHEALYLEESKCE